MNQLPDHIAAAMSGLHITIHTDGAAYRNPGPGGWGAVLCRMDGEAELRRLERRGFDPDPTTTNIRMEMTAVARALEFIKPGEPRPVIIRPDLKLIVQGVTEWLPGWAANGWRNAQGKPVENPDLWQRIVAATEGKIVLWQWVRGHNGDERNELAHTIADEQMRKAMLAAYAVA